MNGLFEPQRAEIWRQLSEQTGARYTTNEIFAGDRIDAQIGNWIVTMDLLEGAINPTTRLRAPFRNPSGLRFSISRAEVVPGRVNGQGGHDITVGDPFFDDSFLVKGNNPTLVVNLLQNAEIRSLLEGLPWVHFEIRDSDFWVTLPQDCDELHFLAFNSHHIGRGT